MLKNTNILPIGGVPPGTVLDFAGDVAPNGYLICDGSTYNKSNYPNLWEVVGNKFGGSDPTFNVPDLRDKFTKGKGTGDNIGDSGGSADADHTHSVTWPSYYFNKNVMGFDQLNHSHTDGSLMARAALLAAANELYIKTTSGSNYNANYKLTLSGATSSTQSTGGGIEVSGTTGNNTVAWSSTNQYMTRSGGSVAEETIDNRPPYVTMNKIIKY
jgi:microcystin-dependent protein